MKPADFGINIGGLPRGPRNSISDVPGVSVGHATIDSPSIKSGVTAILPCPDSPFRRKLTAACQVFNGFGKSVGLTQIDELGTLETPIALTNTLAVGAVSDSVVKYMLATHPEIVSVNPVVLECNDAYLSDIRSMPVGGEHFLRALKDASPDFAEGAVGAGTGMSCHGLKGGIGTSSRIIDIAGRGYTLSALVMTNHGLLEDLTIAGRLIGPGIAREISAPAAPDKGSCIVVMATDLPVSSRQLRRIVRRASVGLSKSGAYISHGSGEIAVGFTTANRVPDTGDIHQFEIIAEPHLDDAFRAAAEVTEESVINAMLSAGDTTGVGGKVRFGLRRFLKYLNV